MADEKTHPEPDESGSVSANTPDNEPSDAPTTPGDELTSAADAPLTPEEHTAQMDSPEAAEEPRPQPSPASPEDNAVDQAELDALLSAQVRDAEQSVTGGAPPPQDSQAESPAEPDLAAMMSQAESEVQPSPENDSIAEAMASAIAAEEQGLTPPAAAAEEKPDMAAIIGATPVAAAPEDAEEYAEPEFAPFPDSPGATIDMLDDVQLDVKIELGRTSMYIEEVLKLGEGSVVELDKLAGDPVDIYANGRLIARGEVLVLNDNFCVRINDIHSPIPELNNA